MTDILSTLPKRRPFKAPEGYLDNLTARIMAQIPAVATTAAAPAAQLKPVGSRRLSVAGRVVRFIPWLGTASIAAMVAVFAHFNTPGSARYTDVSASLGAATASMTDDTRAAEIDDAFDYMMLDNANLISYATEN